MRKAFSASARCPDAERLAADLGLDVAEHQAVVALAQPTQPRLHLERLAPTPLLLVELLEPAERVDVLGVHLEHVLEGLGRAVDEAR